ncbi:MAG: TrbI F-type domain-containing protein [Rhodospirillales bacterium]|nr:TrbI F-type domain-containing protein [Rhodospirillales bacterium]
MQMNGKAVRMPGDVRLWIEEDSDAVFDAAIRAGVLSEDPEDERFAGYYMYMHHDGDGTAWFKHRETRAYITMGAAPGRAASGRTAPGSMDAGKKPGRFARPGKALWATVVLAGVFLAGALMSSDRDGPRVGTVRLNDLTAEFYAGAVQNADSPEAAAQAARDWGMRLETALDLVARRHGVVLLPVEAVAAGAVDYTVDVRVAMRWAVPGPDAPGTAAPGTAAPGGAGPQRPEPAQ